MDCLLALNASGQLSHGQFNFGHLSLVVTFAKTVRTDFFLRIRPVPIIITTY